MTDKNLNNDLRFASLKNDATRQRWEMFHRAIALAKQSNAEAMEKEQFLEDSLAPASDTPRQRAEPLLSIAR
jgi:hypothetical protein